MVRIIDNHDWVIYTILGCVFVYAIMFLTVLREVSWRDFLVQEIEDSSNSFLIWILTSIIYTVLLSVLISQFVPMVPKVVSEYEFQGFELNKFGYTLCILSVFFLFKIALTYLFYSAIGNIKKWRRFYFTTTRFFFVVSLMLIFLNIFNFYFTADKNKFLSIYVLFFSFIFVLKQFIYLFHKNKMLPEKWYYKILYICTFQIAPVFALWRLLFF